MIYILIPALILFFLGVIESFFHFRNLSKIPTVIHVNGTRGKSTTTRLIAGGLRESGLKVVAKTTGTAPRLIWEDGSEKPIKRRGKPNIIENLKVVSFAARKKADVLVMECMALHPEMQWISENRMLKSNIGVITNVGEDHLEVMGPLLEDVARTMALMVPRGGALITPNGDFNEIFSQKAKGRETKIIFSDPNSVLEKTLKLFPYISFKENIATALEVCELMGVKREDALSGMIKANPDPGVSFLKRLERSGTEFFFINAFAANDKKSTLLTWEKVQKNVSGNKVIGILNNRNDRPLRIHQLADIFNGDIKLEELILVGEWGLSEKRFIKKAFSGKILDFKKPKRVEKILDYFVDKEDRVFLFGFGNTRGMGEQFIKFFQENGDDTKC